MIYIEHIVHRLHKIVILERHHMSRPAYPRNINYQLAIDRVVASSVVIRGTVA